MDKALVGIDLTVDGNVITAPVGEVELEEGSKQLKLSHANKPHRSPIVHSIDHGAFVSRLSSEATAINSPVLQNIIGINSSLGGLQDPDVIINHAAAMGTALSPVGTPAVTLRAYRCDQDLVNAYYIFIHPYFSFLPPPMCLSMKIDLETARKLRRSYARAALAGVESFLDEYEHMGTAFSSDMDLSRAPQSPLQSGLPLPVEPVLALALLAIYEVQIQQLDTFISEVAAEADRFRWVTNIPGLSRCLLRSVGHVPRFDPHRITVISPRSIPLSSRDRPIVSSPARVADIECIFPFTEQESTSICLKSALVMSRVFRQLSSPNPDSGLEADGKASDRSRSPRGLPHMACCTLQRVYAICMLLSKVRTALCSGDLSSCCYLLDRPTPAADVQDAERLTEELQQVLNALSASIRADAVFEGMAAMAREMEGILCYH
ncbi:hypothetical protein CNMCM6936_004677 [Aspergillus lentulus]|nr:hypothetical protein CNMCM6936_004677 [Aspergillus lentulus]KAF4190019.1 hypothetical protein CNMCM7927_005829 [Aspergillus lentulus]